MYYSQSPPGLNKKENPRLQSTFICGASYCLVQSGSVKTPCVMIAIAREHGNSCQWVTHNSDMLTSLTGCEHNGVVDGILSLSCTCQMLGVVIIVFAWQTHAHQHPATTVNIKRWADFTDNTTRSQQSSVVRPDSGTQLRSLGEH